MCFVISNDKRRRAKARKAEFVYKVVRLHHRSPSGKLMFESVHMRGRYRLGHTTTADKGRWADKHPQIPEAKHGIYAWTDEKYAARRLISHYDVSSYALLKCVPRGLRHVSSRHESDATLITTWTEVKPVAYAFIYHVEGQTLQVNWQVK